jgi:hypothetical protein
LFNLVIFAYHKVCVNLRSDEDLTVGEAFRIVFLYPEEMEDSAQVHNLDFVFEDCYGIDNKYAPEHSNVVEIEMGIDGCDEDLSGFQENGNLEAEGDHDIQLDLGKASMAGASTGFVSVEEMPSMGEQERCSKYKCY